MTITFYLTRPEAAKETSIFARINYNGHRVKFYTPESIHPDHWNQSQQRAAKSLREAPEFNQRIKNLKADIADVFRKWVNDNDGEFPTPETLKKELERAINKKEPEGEAPKSFLPFFQYIVDQSKTGGRMHHKTGQPINKNTLKTYVTTLKHLAAYQIRNRRKLEFASIDLDFYSDYTEYLMKVQKLATNSVGKHIQIIKLIMNEATERGINKNLKYKSKRFVTVRENSDSIYLTEAELKALEALDLDTDRLRKVRDLFLVGAYTGLRYSDYSILAPEHIKGGFIELI
ncbi:MAG: site-specific integrase, partial [Chitinophagaceae bacterium]